MFDVGSVRREPNPPWAINIENPLTQFIQRGILYTGLEPPTLRFIMNQIMRPERSQGTTEIEARAAVGPCLFWGLEDERFIPWDVDAIDENRECKVRDRTWPFSWGDHIWACTLWEMQPLFLKWELEGFCQLYLGKPEPSIPIMKAQITRWMRGVATMEAGQVNLSPVLEKGFWLESGPPVVTKWPG